MLTQIRIKTSLDIKWESHRLVKLTVSSTIDDGRTVVVTDTIRLGHEEPS